MQKLRLKKKKTNVRISGLGKVTTEKSNSLVAFKIKIGGEEVKIKALVVPKVTRNLPKIPAHVQRLANGKVLADTTGDAAAPVLILLGANITPMSLIEGVETIDQYLFQQTRLG